MVTSLLFRGEGKLKKAESKIGEELGENFTGNAGLEMCEDGRRSVEQK